jgi:hypothetical protein
MKKLSILLTGLALVAFTFSSCKKEYTCVCTDSDDGDTDSYTYPKAKKSDAKAWCEAESGGSWTCELD